MGNRLLKKLWMGGRWKASIAQGEQIFYHTGIGALNLSVETLKMKETLIIVPKRDCYLCILKKAR